MFEPEAKSVVWGISAMLLIVGAVSHIASIASPHWLANPSAHLGLWRYCTAEGQCTGVADQLSDVGLWFRAVQGLEIAATVFVLSAIVTGIMRVNMGHRIWQIGCGLSAIVAGVMAAAGVIVFSKNCWEIKDQTLSWAFVFNAVSCGMSLLAGPVIILDSLLQKS